MEIGRSPERIEIEIATRFRAYPLSRFTSEGLAFWCYVTYYWNAIVPASMELRHEIKPA